VSHFSSQISIFAGGAGLHLSQRDPNAFVPTRFSTIRGLCLVYAAINVHEGYELRYWSERFDVPRDEIEAAVKRVGTRVEDGV
jgi:hypothetical protein